MLNNFFSRLIRIYQLILSPILKGLGGRCRFYPTCSEYSVKAYRQFNWRKATKLTITRILRCNPLNPGGVDFPE